MISSNKVVAAAGTPKKRMILHGEAGDLFAALRQEPTDGVLR
jgi:hypothetical protein